MCLDQDRSEEITIPNYLYEDTRSSADSSTYRVGEPAGSLLHFLGFNVNLQENNQAHSSSMSLCRRAKSSGQVIFLWSKRSSAKRTILPPDSCIPDKPSMYIRNNSGPRTEPCGTPEITLVGDESSPITPTCWTLLCK